jgi:hypothetical protein
MERIRFIVERLAGKLFGFAEGVVGNNSTRDGLEGELRRRIAIHRSEQERIYFEGYDDD